MKKIDYILMESQKENLRNSIMLINCPHLFGLQDCNDDECYCIVGELSCEECWNREIEEEE